MPLSLILWNIRRCRRLPGSNGTALSGRTASWLKK
jgi:hypothetical protein